MLKSHYSTIGQYDLAYAGNVRNHIPSRHYPIYQPPETTLNTHIIIIYITTYITEYICGGVCVGHTCTRSLQITTAQPPVSFPVTVSHPKTDKNAFHATIIRDFYSLRLIRAARAI